jgi:hypothetical protein
MWYDSATQSVIVAAGASRPDPANRIHTIDHKDVWQIFPANTAAGWKTSSIRFPYYTNHVGRATVNIPGVGERHYALGGQTGELEKWENHADVYELNMSNFSWAPRKFMPYGRGHISESTLTYKSCGFIIVAGAVNEAYIPEFRTSDISFYDIASDTWTSIGKFTDAVATPICAIHGGYLYCQSGYVWKHITLRRKIE